MRLSEHKDLKIEILALPQKEKDKLLLRLVAKDKVLTERLNFLLIEDEGSLRERTTVLKEEILQLVETMHYANAKEVLIFLRKIVKSINHFVKVTKANFEDVELRVFLFTHIPSTFTSKFFNSYKNHEHLFSVYFVKSVLAIIKKFEKLHEDLQFDLREDLNNLLNKAYQKNMASQATDLGLPKQL